MPFPLAEPPAAHSPSHLPSQSTATPPSAVQAPSHVPEQLPSHAMLAPPSAWQLPLHDTSSFPPSQVGGFAFTSHLASTLQFAWQFASALNDALHSGGVACILSAPFAPPCALNAASIFAEARSHQNFTLFAG